jgi:hypothetical protein
MTLYYDYEYKQWIMTLHYDNEYEIAGFIAGQQYKM